MKRLKKIFLLLLVMTLLVNNFAGVFCANAEGSEDISVDLNIYGPYLEKINYPGSFSLENVLDDGKFGDTWEYNGFASGSTVVPLRNSDYVYIGDYDFSHVKEIKIKYSVFDYYSQIDKGIIHYSYVGLSKVAERYSFEKHGFVPEYSNAICSVNFSSEEFENVPVSRSLTIKDIDRTYKGSVWLASFATGFGGENTIAVTGITFVYEKGANYSVSTGKVSNGTIKLSSSGTVAPGEKITITATPASGYKVYDIFVNNKPIQGNTFNVANDSVVTAAFVKENVTEGLLYNIKDNEVEIWDYVGTKTDIVIPEMIGEYPVTSIGHDAFEDCLKIESVYIPAYVKEIGNMAFFNCPSLKSFSVDEKSKYFRSHEGVLFTKEYAFLVWYPRAKADKSFIIPKGVGTIKETAFMNNKNLLSIYIPKDLFLIEHSAFYLTNITDVYYEGTEAEWNKIKIETLVPQLTLATIHYNSVNKVTEKPSEPTVTGSEVPVTSSPTETPETTHNGFLDETIEPAELETPAQTSKPGIGIKDNKTDKGFGVGAVICIAVVCLIVGAGVGIAIYLFVIKKK